MSGIMNRANLFAYGLAFSTVAVLIWRQHPTRVSEPVGPFHYDGVDPECEIGETERARATEVAADIAGKFSDQQEPAPTPTLQADARALSTYLLSLASREWSYLVAHMATRVEWHTTPCYFGMECGREQDVYEFRTSRWRAELAEALGIHWGYRQIPFILPPEPTVITQMPMAILAAMRHHLSDLKVPRENSVHFVGRPADYDPDDAVSISEHVEGLTP
ncbi:hypothetical protein JMUB6875_48230 [Nocardia sp. JMUB6875]|uniref:hypothetical protein n=1 Tax=Nocardia sp. JMUB6875 TaxID=3158170 RepID=UPI0032E7196E